MVFSFILRVTDTYIRNSVSVYSTGSSVGGAGRCDWGDGDNEQGQSNSSPCSLCLNVRRKCTF